MRFHRSLLNGLTFLLLLSISITAGCDSKEDTAPGSDDVDPAATSAGGTEDDRDAGTESEGTDSTASFQLTPIDQAGLDELVAGHKGDVVLVDFWATWCGPCIKKLPAVAKLHQTFGKEGLQVYSVAIGNHTDEEATAAMKKTLVNANASFEHLVSNHQKDQAAFNDFGLSQVPHYRLYNRDGELVGKFDGMPEDLEDQIVALLSSE